MNEVIKLILKYCAICKLSVNFKKTNYMLITSSKKKNTYILFSEMFCCVVSLRIFTSCAVFICKGYVTDVCEAERNRRKKSS